MNDNIKLLVGLGNPGIQYQDTRHNIGWMVIKNLALNWKIPLNQSVKFQSLIGQINLEEKKIILAAPTTYMNLSGHAVKIIVDYFKINIDNILIIYDDIDLLFGKIRIRSKGGDGGHKGLKSIISCLGNQNLKRLRIGIGPLPEHMELSDFVLSKFYPEEQVFLSEIILITLLLLSLIILP